ncbi:MAG: UvrD-helicase domain-containing protein [Bacteroidales bacterium]|nr:UvrD-helicase domain-containing protein [Candidatus Colicola faecequi]
MKYEIDLERPLNVCKASAGTGKTFTLAAYYIGLLMSGVHYGNILAVTFTNKATAEMKERILSQLNAIACGTADSGFLAKVRTFLLPNATLLTDEQLRGRAAECFKRMLEDYDNMRISTIDSFLQTLLTGASQMLGMGSGLTTELNVKGVISRAVDELLTTDINPEVSSIVSEYVGERIDAEKGWDVRTDIINMAMKLFDESAQQMAADGKVEFDPAKIAAYKRSIDWRRLPEVESIRKKVTLVPDVEGGTGLKTVVKNIRKMCVNALACIDGKLTAKDGLSVLTSKDKDVYFAKEKQFRDLYGQAYDVVLELADLIAALRPLALSAECTSVMLNDMRLMSALVKQIDMDLDLTNKDLLARTASRLHAALKTGDADFILEKAGIRYTHVLMDEFQDTSRLQWSVFQPLLEELLSTGEHSLLVVGDVKQSIYRWRNGDWHIMEGLTSSSGSFSYFLNDDFQALRRNFRSAANVVNFNLREMQHMVEMEVERQESPARKHQLQEIFEEHFSESNLPLFYNANGEHEGGYVCVKAYPCRSRKKDDVQANASLTRVVAKKHILADMFSDMERLLAMGEQASDMMVLVRKRNDAQEIADAFQRLMAEDALNGHPQYPHLAGQRIVSCDSFHLDTSSSVMLIVCGLRYMQTRDQVAEYYIRKKMQIVSESLDRNLDMEKVLSEIAHIDRRMPLFELAKELMRICCFDEEGRFFFDDAAYLNCFLDKLRDYVSANGSDRAAFLQYWEDNMHKESIAAPDSDGIRLMTVHSAKGLQAHSLFIPFAEWNMVDNKGTIWCESMKPLLDGVEEVGMLPIGLSADLEETCYADQYDEEQYQMRIDNLNLLYVALTRAEDNLFVYVPQLLSSDKNKVLSVSNDTVGSLLVRSLSMTEALIGAFESYEDTGKSCFCEHTEGVPKIKRPKVADAKNKDATSIFRFDNAEPIPAEEHFCDKGIRFRQSQESTLYERFGDAARAEDQLRQIALGNMCHDIFARMRVASDASAVIREFRERGIISSDEQMAEVTRLVNGAWQTDEMSSWFDGSWQLLREQSLFFEGREMRPDRVMIRGKEAVVLDYKFGRDHDIVPQQYIDQVRSYMAAMRAIGYTQVSGYLWFAQKQEGQRLVKIHND